MARFYASIQGNRGDATRAGNASSGITGHIRGWDIGCRVYCGVDSEGNDYVNVSITSGSNGNGPEKCIFRGTRADYDKLIDERKEKLP